MKKVLFSAMIAATILTGCSKSDEVKPTATEGVIRFSNTSDNPYTIFIDGNNVGSVKGKKFVEKKKTAGTYELKAIQESGYLVYPTEREVTMRLNANSEIEFVFP